MFRSAFDDDPFFQDPFREMHQMMSPVPQRNYITAGRRHTEPHMAMSPFGMFGNMGFGNMFSRMDAMMNGMQSQMQMMQSGAGMPSSGQSFHSSFTSISYGGGDGQPKVYQSSSSTKVGPNGVSVFDNELLFNVLTFNYSFRSKKLKKVNENSVTGLQKMAIGHHIGERAHVIEKSQNSRTGEKEESQEFVNIEEGTQSLKRNHTMCTQVTRNAEHVPKSNGDVVALGEARAIMS
uniref:Myeloid leukemia factor 2 n=1 Tax=Phallusia mammillata TaxID=59560 RepID=A0A6F9DLM2_9ASCI|nr:myeloid leukemia factor 2 [Phallusia mammillata]